jgi:hypothetical protein
LVPQCSLKKDSSSLGGTSIAALKFPQSALGVQHSFLKLQSKEK